MLHSRLRALLLALLLAAVALSGCLSDDAPADQTATTDTPPAGDGSAGGSATAADGANPGNDTGEPVLRTVGLSANQTSGLGPLNVAFSLTAEGLDDGASWVLALGDGGNTTGSAADLPATVNHTYHVDGNITANFTVTYGDGEQLTQLLNLTISAPLDTRPPPEVHFELGQAAGCAGDVIGIVEGEAHLGLNCYSFREGPEVDPVDGFWIPLDDRHWGMALASTTDQGAGAGGAGGFLGDSDCVFTDADFAVIGEAHGSSGSCAGTVPEGTAWLFAYYYAAPGVSLIIDFANN